MTPVGFEPTPLRNGALSHRLRPLGQSVDECGVSYDMTERWHTSWTSPMFFGGAQLAIWASQHGGQVCSGASAADKAKRR